MTMKLVSMRQGFARKLVAFTAVLAVISACESSTSSSTEAPATTTTTTTTIPVQACAGGENCAVGSSGPGGGTVVYVSPTEFACGEDLSKMCNMVEAAPSRWATTVTVPNGCTFSASDTDPKCPWGLSGMDTTKLALAGELGRGIKNSQLMKEKDSGAASAAVVALSYRGGGFSDWALPSEMEGRAVCNYAQRKSTLLPGHSTACRMGADGKWASLPTAYWMSMNLGKSSANYGGRIDMKGMWPISGDSRNSLLAVRPVRTFLGEKAAATTTTTVASTIAPTTTARVTTTLAPTTTIKTCAQGGTCVVGDRGPGGGTVYYVSTAGFTCGESLASTCHYLEVSPTDWKASTPSSANCVNPDSLNASCVWGTTTPYVNTSGAVGQGRENNRQITLNVSVLSAWATVVSRAYQGGGKSDWFLPSQHELDELCKYANGKPTGNQQVGCTAGTIQSGFNNMTYWSSNDGGSGTAIAINFATGQQSFPAKTNAYLIRPIRAF